jgi:Holliday junction resolvase RusA-like endonuclease
MTKITINLAPITKKNSQRIIQVHGRPMIMPSAKYKQYEKNCAIYLQGYECIDQPVNVKCLFYMPTHRRVDLVNLEESICDVLVKHGVLADDNSNIVVSMDGSRVLYDKENPRTEVEITPIEC